MKRFVYEGRWKLYWGLLLAACVVHVVLFYFIAYRALPQVIPTNFGIDGTVEKTGDKLNALILAFAPLFVTGGVFIAPLIDPKGDRYLKFRGVHFGLGTVLSVVMALLAWTIAGMIIGWLPQSQPAFISVVVFGPLGIMMLGLGNYLPRIRPNYSFGIRLPWTLADENNWRVTHRFAAPIMVLIGVAWLISAAIAFFGQPRWSLIVAMASLTGGLVVIAGYSYLYWRRSRA